MAKLTEWKTPKDYAGYDPVGHFIVASCHRDSHFSDEINFEAASCILEEADEDDHEWKKTHDESITWVWRASSWAWGWIDYLMIHKDAPEKYVKLAEDLNEAIYSGEILDDLAYQEKIHEIFIEYLEEVFWEGIEVDGIEYDMKKAEVLCAEVGEDIQSLSAGNDWGRNDQETGIFWDELKEVLVGEIERMHRKKVSLEIKNREDLGQTKLL